jgi:hypothetical protein
VIQPFCDGKIHDIRESCAGSGITHERFPIACSREIQAPPRGSWSERPKVT